MNQYFPPYTEPEIDLDLSNYATKSDLNSRTHVDTSSFALKTNLTALKTEVDKLDIDNLIPVPEDLNKLSKEVQEDFTKKADFNTLKTKVDGIDTTKFISKTNYDTAVDDLKLEVPDISALLQTSTFNSKITEIEGKITTAESKIPDISGLATKTQLKTVENKIPYISNLIDKTKLDNKVKEIESKIPDVSGFVKKADYATEITNSKNDYVTNTALTSRLNDLKNTRIADEVKKVVDRANKNSSDILAYESRLKQKEDLVNELERKIQYYQGKDYYHTDGLPDFLVFKSTFNNFKRSGASVNSWKSSGIHDEDDAILSAVYNSLNALPRLIITSENFKFKVRFSGNMLKQDKIHYNHGKLVNIYITYKLQIRTNNNLDFAIENALVGAVKIKKRRKHNPL